MSEQLTHAKGVNNGLHVMGTKKRISTSAISEVEVREDDEVTIWRQKVPADAVFAHGAGTDSRQTGKDSFVHSDLRNASNEVIKGDLEAVITDSRQRDVLARYTVGDLEDLSDAATDDRTDRPMQPVVGPAAGEDRYLQLRVKADADSNGETISRADSDVRLYYTDIDL